MAQGGKGKHTYSFQSGQVQSGAEQQEERASGNPRDPCPGKQFFCNLSMATHTKTLRTKDTHTAGTRHSDTKAANG